MDSAASNSTGSRAAFSTVLKSLNYRKLLSGQVIAAFGDRINQTALLSIVVYEMGNTAKYSADIMFWAILPTVPLGVFAVALIDRWDRQRTMISSDIGRAILALALPLFWSLFPYHYVIYVIVFLSGAFGALFAPCRLAIMPNLVPRPSLLAANAISSQAGTVATLAAMPIGGWIVENLGRNTSFIINAVTYLISAMFIWHLRPIQDAYISAARPASQHPLLDFRTGFDYIRKTPPVWFYVLFTGIVNCLVAIFFVCFLSYGVDVLGQTVGGTNLLFGSMGLGMAGGAIWLGRHSAISERFSWPMTMLACSGVGMLLLSRIYNPWPASLVLAAIGFCAVMVMVPVDTYLQKNVPDAFRGRVFVARGVLVGIAFLGSLQFSKTILFHLGALDTLRVLGILSLVLGFMGNLIGRRCVDGSGQSLH